MKKAIFFISILAGPFLLFLNYLDNNAIAQEKCYTDWQETGMQYRSGGCSVGGVVETEFNRYVNIDVSNSGSCTEVAYQRKEKACPVQGKEGKLEIEPSEGPPPLCAWSVYEGGRIDGSWGYCQRALSGKGIETYESYLITRYGSGSNDIRGVDPEYCYYTKEQVVPLPPGNRGSMYCPPIEKMVKFTVTADRINEQGKFTINWKAQTATKCALSGKATETGNFSEDFDAGATSLLGGSRTYDYVKRGIYSFKFECTGYLDNNKSIVQGIIAKTLTVYVGNIPPSPAVELKVEPSSIKKGEGATLSWKVNNAVSISVNQGIGIVKSSGSVKVSPAFTTRYTITATGEFSELGLSSRSVTLNVVAPEKKAEEVPIEIPPEEKPVVTAPKVAEKLDLKVNGVDGPLTIKAPASVNLSWNIDAYCLAYGSWVGIKTKAGSDLRSETKAGTYTYRLYCPGYGSDEAVVKVVGGTGGTAVSLPVAEASISLDGKNFSKSIRVVRGEPVKIWLSAAYDIDGNKKISRDNTGEWTNLLSLGGRCEWNSDLNQGNPVFESAIFDPQNSQECVISLGELKFYDKAGVYRYGVLRLVQNDGKVSNIGYVNIAVEDPPPPKGPPVIDLRINNLKNERISLGAPAEYVVSWDVKDADSCVASGSWAGNKFLGGAEKFVSSVKKDFIYTLTCVGKLGTSIKTINLKVAELPVCDFSALPFVINRSSVLNRQSALSWKCQYANSCSISPEVEIGGATFGSTRVSPLVTTKYVLTCSNLEGRSSFEQLVEVK